jgi:hypothetical protein
MYETTIPAVLEALQYLVFCAPGLINRILDCVLEVVSVCTRPRSSLRVKGDPASFYLDSHISEADVSYKEVAFAIFFGAKVVYPEPRARVEHCERIIEDLGKLVVDTYFGASLAALAD